MEFFNLFALWSGYRDNINLRKKEEMKIEIDEGKIIAKGDEGRKTIGRMSKIQLLAFALAFAASMMMVSVVHAEAINKDVSELTMKFLDRNDGVYEWTGEQIKPYVGFVNANGSSVGQDSLKITYGTNIELGKGTITVIGLGEEGTDWQYKWYGTKTFEFTITKTENHMGTITINGSYHDEFKFSKNLKKDIKETFYNLPDEIIKSIDKNDLKFISSDKNIFKINKNKNSITVTGVGIAYLSYTIPETAHYRECNGKIRIVSYPPDSNLIKSSNQPELGNSFRFGVTAGKGSKKCKTDFKCKVIFATNKNFKKSSIIKSYTLSKKEFNNQKIKRIKSKNFKKGKNFYVKTYTYKKLSDGRTMYGGVIVDKYKIAKNGRITSKILKWTDPCIK